MSTIINATTTNGVVIQPDNSGSLQLATNNGTTAVTISTSQNVGIGESSPDTKVHIYGASTSGRGQLYIQGSSTVSRFTLANSSDAYALNTYGDSSTSLLTWDTNSGYSFRWTTSDTERMRIDSSGRVTMPSQPAFQAYNAQGQYITGITEAAFNSTYFNIGGHYNTSTGRFTAPIAGRYAFHFDGLFDNISSGHHISMRKNGAQLDGSEGYSDGLNICLSKSMVWNLAAGDYISIFLDTASSRLHQRYGSFCGYLLG